MLFEVDRGAHFPGGGSKATFPSSFFVQRLSFVHAMCKQKCKVWDGQSPGLRGIMK
jgi:hypothetical protein